MKPILFELWGFAFASWYVFFALAVIGGYGLFYFLNSRANADKVLEHAPTLFTICYVSGWLGARGLSIVVEDFQSKTVSEVFFALFSMGPLTFYGGAISGFVAGLVYVKWKRLPVAFLSDSGVIACVFGLGIGRIGCFLNGDDFGSAVQDQRSPPWWSVRFPNLEDGIFRYPVQLQETVASFFIVALGIWLFKNKYENQNSLKNWNAGHIACLVVGLSAMNRFFNEMYRADARGVFLGTMLSTSQGIALVLVWTAVVCAVVLRLDKRSFHT